MKIFYSLILIFISFQSCSSSDSPMKDAEVMPMEGGMQMQEPPQNTASLKGDFVSGAHPTSGKVIVNEAKTLVSFSNFKTDNGPILEVYLASDTSASNYITLGVLKGVEGNYQYVLPTNVDFKVYNHVIIWCVDFKINFGYAVLK